MSTIHPLRRLEAVEEDMASRNGYTNTTRWMIPYADMLTLLLGCLVLWLTMAHTQSIPVAYTPSKNDVIPPSTSSTATALPQTPLDPVKAALASNSTSHKTEMEQTLLEQLHLEGQPVTVHRDQRGVVISFQEQILFAPGEATLSPESEQTLGNLARVLQQTTSPVRVEGHTDDTPIATGAFPSNWELSTTRATTIVKSLVTRHGLQPQRLSAAGYGEFNPMAENSTIEGKHKNRRVDIVLVNPISE
jgi:chemotaxis protein MotB